MKQLIYGFSTAFMLLSASLSAQTTWRVDPSGVGDFVDIASAIEAAVDGDTILVADAIYTGVNNTTLILNGKDLVIQSENGPAACIIDGENSAPGFILSQNEPITTTIQGFTIRRAKTTGHGSAVMILNSSGTVRNCIFTQGIAPGVGGAIYVYNGNINLENCIISKNSASFAGALYLEISPNAVIRNCTISQNQALADPIVYPYANAVMFWAPTTASFANNIVWGNFGGTGIPIDGGDVPSNFITVAHCNIEGGLPSGFMDGGGNINADPIFSDTAQGNYHLFYQSPCINAGDPVYVPQANETDIDGEMRLLDSVIDMGADEFNADCNNNGMLDAIDIANGISLDCNENSVPDECIYLELDCNGNLSPDSCDILDGESLDCNVNGIPDDCIYYELDCNANLLPDSCDIAEGNSLDCNGNTIPDSCDLAAATELDCNANAILDSCDIASAFSLDKDLNAIPDECQFVIRVPADYPTIQAAIDAALPTDMILLADGIYTGAGNKDLSYKGKDLTVMSENGPNNCIIDCQGSGRGFFIRNQETKRAVIAGLTIKNGNVIGDHGGGIYLLESSPTIHNCIITNNQSTAFGGGIEIANGFDPPIVIRNCLIANNYARLGGGGIHMLVDGEVRNCTIVNNTSDGSGGGINYHSNGTPFELNSCIIWGNSAPSGHQLYKTPISQPVIRNSFIQGGVPADILNGAWVDGGGNSSLDPQFVDFAGGDYHLLASSPCINAGDASFAPLFTETDIDNNSRQLEISVDAGAYERFSDCNGNNIADGDDLLYGASDDCDENGFPDECALDDCNNNLRPDSCDIYQGLSDDCNASGIPDECEVQLPATFSITSPDLKPFGDGGYQLYEIILPPRAGSDVALTVEAKSDLDGSSKFVDVYLNDNLLDTLFEKGAKLCGISTPETIVLTADSFNNLIAGGNALLKLQASPSVFLSPCNSTWIRVSVSYDIVEYDCNANLEIDSCENRQALKGQGVSANWKNKSPCK